VIDLIRAASDALTAARRNRAADPEAYAEASDWFARCCDGRYDEPAVQALYREQLVEEVKSRDNFAEIVLAIKAKRAEMRRRAC
jgi:hypothetical protein